MASTRLPEPMRGLCACAGVHLIVFVLAAYAGWRTEVPPMPAEVVSTFLVLTFEILSHNLGSLLLLAFVNLCTVGAFGLVMMAGNGYFFRVVVDTFGVRGTLAFAPLEVLSFCIGGGSVQYLSLEGARWAFGSRETPPDNEARLAILAFLVAGVGLGAAAALESAVILP